MADRDPSTVNVVDSWIDPKLVATVENLAGKGFVQLPQPNVADLEPMKLQQLGDRIDRSDAHLLRGAAGDGHASVDAQRLESAPAGRRRVHQDACRSAIRELTRVARTHAAAFHYRLQR